MELQIDTDRPGDFGPRLSSDDFQVSLSPGDFGALPPSAWLFQGTPGGDMLDAPAGHTIVVAARPTADGYTLEAAIPWTDLGPRNGLRLKLRKTVRVQHAHPWVRKRVCRRPKFAAGEHDPASGIVQQLTQPRRRRR